MKRSLLFFIFICYGFISSGQDFNTTLKLGYISSWLTGKDAIGMDQKPGIRIGYSNRRYFSSNDDSYDIGFTYSKLGATGKVDSLDLKINCLDFPIDLRVNVYYGLILQVGLEPSMLLLVKSGNNELLQDIFNPEILIPIDFRYSFGLGYESQSGFGIDFYYKASMYSLGMDYDEYNSSTNTYKTTKLDLKNNFILLSLSHTFK